MRSALAAVGTTDPIDLTLDQRAVQQEIDRVVARMGNGRPTYRRARRLHRLLQREHLLRYRHDADSLSQLVGDGRYNCVSGTLFFGLIARRLGYEVQVLESPGHLLLRLTVDGRSIDVETTARSGFDRGPSNPSHLPAVLRAAGPLRSGPAQRELPLEAAVGFAWLNRAWRIVEQGEPLRAAELAIEAARHLPEEAVENAGVRRLLAQAFRMEYEKGSFRKAFRIAALEVRAFPTRTTSRDRLLAAAIKRIADACDDDDPELAAAVLTAAETLAGESRDVDRLVRRGAPLVAAAAVRLGEWELALRAARRYAEVEPDRQEAWRLLDWVEARSSRSPTPVDAWRPRGLPR